MLKPEDKIFKNLYNELGWEIENAIKRDDWKDTKNIISKGRERIINEVKTSELRGSEKLNNIAKEVTGCNIGETSNDKLFTVVEVECLGACCNSPMVQINDNYYEDLDEKSTIEILDSLIKDKPLKPGSYRGRKSTAPERKQLKNGENYA